MRGIWVDWDKGIESNIYALRITALIEQDGKKGGCGITSIQNYWIRSNK